jgi:oligoendopeptidase F
MMKLDQLHYYDLYAPLVAPSTRIHAGEAQKLVLAAVAPLGPSTRRRSQPRSTAAGSISTRTRASVGRVFERRRLRRPPVHADQLQRQYNDVSTLATSSGHTMQSYFSNKTQPYPLAGYPIFVAEVASTFNESLLIDYMLEQIKDPTRGCRCWATTSRASRARCSGRRSSPSSSCGCTRWRRRASRLPAMRSASSTGHHEEYYGHDQGVCVVDDYIAHEWSYIPHFYRDFYVFQYATSFTASAALAEKSRRRSRRRSALPGVPVAGGSKYPIDLLKDAGVDMTTDEPLDLTIKR